MSEGKDKLVDGVGVDEKFSVWVRLRLCFACQLLSLTSLFDPKFSYRILKAGLEENRRKERIDKARALCSNQPGRVFYGVDHSKDTGTTTVCAAELLPDLKIMIKDIREEINKKGTE